MTMPIATSRRTTPSHAMLHNFHVNVKAFGAVGDGVANDTAAIQAALDAGENIFFPSGVYKVTSTLNLPVTGPRRLSGVVGTNNTGLGARIEGNVAGPILSRGTSSELGGPVIENLAIKNSNAAGTGIYIDGNFVPAGIYGCYINAYRGIILNSGSASNLTLGNNRIVNPFGGLSAGSIGIYTPGQTSIIGSDIVGFEHGVRMDGGAIALLQSRIEVCKLGIMIGQDITGASSICHGPFISGVGMEACDTFIQLNSVRAGFISSVHLLGTAGSPSAGAVRGFYATGGALYTTISACTEGGSFSTGFVDISGPANKSVTFIDTSGTTWVLSAGVDVSLIDCEVNGARKTRLSGPFAVPSKIEISLTGGQNNWNPTGLSSASALRIDPNGAYTITGLQGGEEGRVLHLMNISGVNTVTLAHESGSSTAANRFACPGGVNFAIPIAGGVSLFYDNNASIPRWRVLA